ncbi:MAG: serine/threonine protein kinase, partial [Actinobacteria bacterium]|nr:serine/threonine protein kinase [Actinomycetota bacterium]
MGTAHEPVAARPGLTVGHRYELRALLGTGGMAQVWSATDQSLGRVVAVKLLHPHLVNDASSVERFRREAVAVAALSHPNIVAVFDTLFGNGVEAIVMEYVDGGTLRSALDDRGTITQNETVQLGIKLASALAHAHAHGVIHRDIKPANILITREGVPKLTDFGIAKGSAETDLTVVGTIMGTPSYLAPEQVQNRPVDRRADLYSLCVVLYEALAGRPPFVGEEPTAIALARLHEDPPPLRQLVPSVDAALAAVLMRGLERSADRRFQSAADLEAALRAPAAAFDTRFDTAVDTAVDDRTDSDPDSDPDTVVTREVDDDGAVDDLGVSASTRDRSRRQPVAQA